jgi:hypothetical protein
VLASTRTKDAVCDALRDAGRPKPMRPDFKDEANMPLLLSCFQVRFNRSPGCVCVS